jgi:hypothetical protein
MTHEESIRKTGGCDSLTALLWCREVNASVHFELSGKVTIYVGATYRCRPTFLEAVLAHIFERK